MSHQSLNTNLVTLSISKICRLRNVSSSLYNSSWFFSMIFFNHFKHRIASSWRKTIRHVSKIGGRKRQIRFETICHMSRKEWWVTRIRIFKWGRITKKAANKMRNDFLTINFFIWQQALLTDQLRTTKTFFRIKPLCSPQNNVTHH